MDKRMKILYISHYFPPEVNAPAVRVSEMSERWAEQGSDVTVLTCFPNHPSGVIPEEYRGLWRWSESRGLTKVIRTYVYAAPNKGFLRRIMNYLSFMLSSIVFGTWIVGKPDVVIATSPQFFVAVAGYVISRLKRAKFIFEVRDLWPEEIVAVGAIKNKFVIGLLEKIEMFLYKKADLIVAVAQGTLEILQRRGISGDKMVLLPNGVDIEHFRGVKQGQDIKKELGLSSKFVVGYIGTHGMAHKLDIVLETASLLREQEDIAFLFVGDGAEKEKLISQARCMSLRNVIFHPQIPRDKIPAYYSACDTCLVPLRKADLFTKNIPSKIYEIMASMRPIIISTDGESRKLVESSGAGLAAKPEDPQDLARKILFLKSNGKTCQEMGQNGLSFVLASSSRQKLADEYISQINNIVFGKIGHNGANKIPSNTEYKDSISKRQEVSA
jgi:colanic acid biosynthesis glycosyl transferase WcaI